MDNHILQEAARTYNTPCYIFDLDVFISRIRRMEQILGKQVNIYYAMKANPFLTAAAAQPAAWKSVPRESMPSAAAPVCRPRKSSFPVSIRRNPTSARSWQSREPEPTQLNP